MRRFYTLWLYAVTLAAFALAAIQSTLEERRVLRDTDAKTAALATTFEDSFLAPLSAKSLERVAKTANRLKIRHGIAALSICSDDGFRWSTERNTLCDSPQVKQARETGHDIFWSPSRTAGYSRFLAHPSGSQMLIMEEDLPDLRTRWLEAFAKTAILTWLAGALLLVLMASQVRNWLDQLASKVRALPVIPKRFKEEPVFSAVTRAMHGKNLVVIANREPYIHQKRGDKIEVIRPASGLVTALEPVLRNCGGLWIAHGGGSADVETANENGEVSVPPGAPKYTLRRVWLNQEEEEGYYYGFSNEGLWPLCHLAHHRPSFRLSDWRQYQEVNQKFALSIPQKSIDGGSVILVQDYHFALLPRMIKDRATFGRKQPQVGIFWHIPWPNPEAFGILPWGQKLLKGMLGSDVIGFHTQYHCNNFLETCDRYLEARVDWERFSVTMGNHETRVRAFPIGIETSSVRPLSYEDKQKLKEKLGITAEFVAVGVDRLDYTKGLLERVESVERFLEKNPKYVGKFSLVQVGSPSRTHIPAYRRLAEDLDAAVKRITAKFADPKNPAYRPIILIAEHHEWDFLKDFYQIGDVCMVTSLHDGMNLVAKEYIWCQKADQGSLILSKFAGASRELSEAFIVNPYSIEEMADAIAASLSLDIEEKTRRMLVMKEKVRTHDAHHWAADLIESVLKTNENVPIPLLKKDRGDKSKSVRGSA